MPMRSANARDRIEHELTDAKIRLSVALTSAVQRLVPMGKRKKENAMPEQPEQPNRPVDPPPAPPGPPEPPAPPGPPEPPAPPGPPETLPNLEANDGEPSTTTGVVKGLLGVMLLVAGWVAWRKRPGPNETA